MSPNEKTSKKNKKGSSPQLANLYHIRKPTKPKPPKSAEQVKREHYEKKRLNILLDAKAKFFETGELITVEELQTAHQIDTNLVDPEQHITN